MRIEVLCFPDCPGQGPAVQRLEQVLNEESVPTSAIEIRFFDPAASDAFSFPGSPTIRINGVDVDPAPPAPGTAGAACRTYCNGTKREPIPPLDLIRRAVRRAQQNEAAP